ncbi:PepSY domain-containing protein [Rhodobacter sp. KR11]|uniref:PepSY domain-containing protein n=1 Tax=Rhodobacter sp. KR11 TaxID=2974588 RepID=UPI0022235BB5|nr:PepSY domain-containing protein [Rhodobacter sp. KR11]MCW1919597.1 PepSY domain-containing protein [Rhodobacter sp. KR11]
MWHRRIKSLHGTLGLLIWPWLVMIALTGLYQNHQSAIDPWLPSDMITAEDLQALPAFPVTTPNLTNPEPVTLFGRPAWAEHDGSRGIDAATGATWATGTYLTTWADAQGARIGWRMDWQKLFLRLHRAGWAGDQLGTWPADLAALALVLFGLSGLWLFLAPRLRRWRR